MLWSCGGVVIGFLTVTMSYAIDNGNVLEESVKKSSISMRIYSLSICLDIQRSVL